jgi:calcineurin-like phosphoesterase family protein
MGNHDSSYPISRYMPYFSTIIAYTKFDKNWLSHVPMHENELYRCKANIHGHLHSKRVMVSKEFDTGIGLMSEMVPDERYVNVSAEHNNLTPISYEDLKKKHPILEGEC